MLSPIEIAIQLGVATTAILFVWRGLIPMAATYAADLFEFRMWRR